MGECEGDLGREMGMGKNKTIVHWYLKHERIGHVDVNRNQLH